MIYREVMHTPRIDWCRMMKEHLNKAKIGSMMSQIIEMLRDSMPTAVHECPYNVIGNSFNTISTITFVLQDLMIQNCSVKTSSMISLFPTGDYKMVFYGYTASGENIFVINTIGSMISPNKDTFG